MNIILFPLLFFCYLIRLFSLPRLRKMGDILGAILISIGFRKRIVASNLQLALGKERSAFELKKLQGVIYKNIGLTFLEIARNFALTKKQMAEELQVSEYDRVRIDEIYARGKGAIFISCHLANWELLAMGMVAHGFPVVIVVKKMNNFFSQMLIERQRQRSGLEIIYTGGVLKKMKAALEQNNAHPRRSRGPFCT